MLEKQRGHSNGNLFLSHVFMFDGMHILLIFHISEVQHTRSGIL